MGVVEKKTFTVACDRCKRTEKTDVDPRTDESQNDWQWWVRRGVGRDGAYHGTTQRLLCRSCAEELEFWMQGSTTYPGRVYNAKAGSRFDSAVSAAINPSTGP